MINLVLLHPIAHGRFGQVQLPSHLPDAAVVPQTEPHRLLLERLGEPSSLPCAHEHLPAHSRAFFGVHKTQGGSSGGWAHYALADDGTLVYLPGSGDERVELVWVDRVTGEETPLAAPRRTYLTPRISPDGTRVVVYDQGDIWIWDLTGETLEPLTVDAAEDAYGIWTPDSRRIIFTSLRSGSPALFSRAADGTGTAKPLGNEGPRYPDAVVPGGSVVVVRETVQGNADLITVSLTGDPVSRDLLGTEFDEQNAVLSPDGRWLAYESNTSGRFEIYVAPFPDAGSAVHRMSTNGGRYPLWAPDGNELFYLESDDRLLGVPVQTTPTFSRGTPTVVVERRYVLGGFSVRHYDIDPSGERFLFIKDTGMPDAGGRSLPSLTFVLDWFDELTEQVPVN